MGKGIGARYYNTHAMSKGNGQGQPMGKDNEHGARVMGKGKDIGQ